MSKHLTWCNLLMLGKGMDEMGLDELDDIEDDIDEEEERLFEEYRYVYMFSKYPLPISIANESNVLIPIFYLPWSCLVEPFCTVLEMYQLSTVIYESKCRFLHEALSLCTFFHKRAPSK